jgi:hypothetical protein
VCKGLDGNEKELEEMGRGWRTKGVFIGPVKGLDDVVRGLEGV